MRPVSAAKVTRKIRFWLGERERGKGCKKQGNKDVRGWVGSSSKGPVVSHIPWKERQEKKTHAVSLQDKVTSKDFGEWTRAGGGGQELGTGLTELSASSG